MISLIKKLIINQGEGKRVRFIFDAYLKCRSEVQTCDTVNAKGWLTKSILQKNGTNRGSKPFKHAVISSILRKPIYISKMPHYDTIYGGSHEAIVAEVP